MKLSDYTWISSKKLDQLEALVRKSQAQLDVERINISSLHKTIAAHEQTIKTLESLLDIEQNNTRNRNR